MNNTSKQIGDSRVAYLVNQYPGISATFIRREIHALEGHGYDVRRYGIRRSPDAVVDPLDVVEQQKTHYVLDTNAFTFLLAVVAVMFGSPIRFHAALTQALRFGRESGLRVRNLIYLAEATVVFRWTRRDDVDHIHCHFGTNSTAVATLCRILGGPKYSFTVHGPEEFDRAESLGLECKVEHCDFVVVVSSFGRSQLYRWIAFRDWGKVRIVHCGLDATYFDRPLTLPPTRHSLLAIGRLHEQKGMPLLVEAVARLAAEDVKFTLTIVGDGPLRGHLESLISRHELQDHIILAGWKTGDEVQELLIASRALIMPSFAEGLPVAIMESLAAGRPVVSTYIAGIPELVRDGIEGWMIPAGSSDALADAMRKVLDCPNTTLAEMGRVGAKRALLRHDVRNEAKKLALLFEGLSQDCEQSVPVNGVERGAVPATT